MDLPYKTRPEPYTFVRNRRPQFPPHRRAACPHAAAGTRPLRGRVDRRSTPTNFFRTRRGGDQPPACTGKKKASRRWREAKSKRSAGHLEGDGVAGIHQLAVEVD